MALLGQGCTKREAITHLNLEIYSTSIRDLIDDVINNLLIAVDDKHIGGEHCLNSSWTRHLRQCVFNKTTSSCPNGLIEALASFQRIH